jgi:hypothetical protein
LLGPGVTQLALEQGLYAFKTLSEARLRIVRGGVDVVTANGTKTHVPNPPSSTQGQGDEPSGESPALTIEPMEAP